MNEINEKNMGVFFQKIEALKKSGGVDLSVAEDLSLAVMNLISLEEHFFFTGAKTGDESYYDFSADIRKMRTSLMKGLVDKHEGETWCATKHILSATMRLIEVGNRYVAEGDREKAKKYFADAYRLYSVFWALKTKLITAEALQKAGAESSEKGWNLEMLVSKLADCCNEK